MKTFEEIRNNPKFTSRTKAVDGGAGYLTIQGKSIFVIYSNGGGWDHVSASLMNRCPTWDEMCEIKKAFFRPDEWCVEYHPAESEYVNIYPYCLHIWKPQKKEIPTPPKFMV